jgi:4-diphosphocytidyl-2-C-methyl-D-erythritol kinase
MRARRRRWWANERPTRRSRDREFGATLTPATAETAPAKINLFLHVVGRRPDGYHLLDSLAVFAGVGDVVTASPAKDWSLEIVGPAAADLSAGPDNLVLRAARALEAECGLARPMRLTLEKNLPVASGIGGGSADAAATLRLLLRLWNARRDAMPLAARLGADVPVCLAGRPARMAGIGERLTQAPELPPFGLALVNPGVAIGTPAVFAARTGDFSPPATLPARWTTAAAMAADLACLRNDLEPPARALAPIVGETLTALAAAPGCLLARMSGSGATCFGIFDDSENAAAAAAGLARPGWWCWGGPGAVDIP